MKKLILYFALLLIYPLIMGTWICAAVPRPDLTGQVTNKQDEPLPKAIVLIAAAGPRQGTSPLCPYSYPDCGKKALTDAKGEFRIESLDPALDFCVLVMAPGYAPFTNSKIIPEAGPVRIKLDRRDFAKVTAEQHVRGRILAPDGNPVIGAMVDVEGEEKGSVTHWGCLDVDGMTLTDANGEFHVVGPKPFNAVQVIIEAPELAKRWARMESGKTGLLRMTSGVTVSGRLVSAGKPLGNIELGISSVDRACGKFLDGFKATTKPDGRFSFNNIPPSTKFQLFSRISSSQNAGVSMRREFDSGPEGQPVLLGDVSTQPTHRVAGRIVLGDGKPVPAGTRILFSREASTDYVLVEADKDGAFTLNGIPEERISITFHIDGYRFSEKNPSLDSNHRGIVGRVTGDIANLVILLEPGKAVPYEELERVSYEEQKKRNELPLKGVQ